VGIIIGAIGTWATAPDTPSIGGMDIRDNWGVITVILGTVCATALFTQLNWGRTTFSLRWAVPISWTVVVASVGCLAIGLVHVVTINSLSEALFGAAHVAQVGWGLWLMIISSAILCVTAGVVAVQIGNASQDYSRPSQAVWASAWRLAAIAGSAVILVCAIVNAYRPLMVDFGNSDKVTEAESQTVTERPAPSTVVIAAPLPPAASPQTDEPVPADAEHCTSNPVNVPLNNSAAGAVTSCPFAENVRDQYIRQPRRATTVTLDVFSPVTAQSYLMTCTGNHVVACRGGNDAVAYLY
jgi:hypothetical protein